jgi:hypothetical protein
MLTCAFVARATVAGWDALVQEHLIRGFDVAAWMLYSKSRAVKKARIAADVEPRQLLHGWIPVLPGTRPRPPARMGTTAESADRPSAHDPRRNTRPGRRRHPRSGIQLAGPFRTCAFPSPPWGGPGNAGL